jgi:hypothetical protein
MIRCSSCQNIDMNLSYLHVDPQCYMGPPLCNGCICALQVHIPMYTTAFPRGMLHIYAYVQVPTALTGAQEK